MAERAYAAGLHVSVSQVRSFLRCPRSYELRYVLAGPPEFVPEPLAFGRAFHAALAHYYENIEALGSAPALEEIEQVFKDRWQEIFEGPVPVLIDDGGANSIDQAVAMLGVFHRAQEQVLLPHVVAVEKAFVVDLHDPETGELLDEQLLGYFDLVLQDGDGAVIVEHKSSARRWSQDQLDHDFQATGYLHAARELGLVNPRTRLQVVTKTKVPALQVEDLERTEADIRDFVELTRGVLRSIDQGISFPVRSWACRTCPYRSACSARSNRTTIGGGNV